MTADTFSSKSCFFFHFDEKSSSVPRTKEHRTSIFIFFIILKNMMALKFFSKAFLLEAIFCSDSIFNRDLLFSVGPINTCGWKTGKSEAGKKICYLVMVMRLMLLQCWCCCSADDDAVQMLLQSWWCCIAEVSLQCHVECCCASWLWSVGHSRKPQDTRAFNLLL